MIRRSMFVLAVTLGAIGALESVGAPIGTAFMYQGQLKLRGVPLNGSADMRFTLWDAPSNGMWSGPAILLRSIPINNGLFSVRLDFGPSMSDGKTRWLQIEVRNPAWDDTGPEPGFVELSPRHEITPVPHALALPGFRPQPKENSPNLLGGWEGNLVEPGVAGATISGGGGQRDGGISYYPNTVVDDFGTIGGGWKNVAGEAEGSTVDDEGATVAGGLSNTASAFCSTVGGGEENQATAIGATVPGGQHNEATGANSLAAGYGAKANHAGTFVWADNTESDFSSLKDNQFLIRASGGVGIGTNNTGTYQLAVIGHAAKSTGTTWAIYSDARLKKNIEPLEGALSRLLSLRGVTFEYKKPGFKLGRPGTQMGMIAQEVEEVLPEWVDEDDEGYKFVTMNGMEALTVEALRDLRKEKDAQIRALQSRIEALEAMVAKLTDNHPEGK